MDSLRRQLRITTAVLMGVLLALVVAVAMLNAVKVTAASPTPSAVEVMWMDVTYTPEQARAALEHLPQNTPASMAGYARTQFGASNWYVVTTDTAKNASPPAKPYWGWDVDSLPFTVGCDAREAALLRDGNVSDVSSDPASRCRPLAGEWIDPYTGQAMTTPSLIDIDHIVPLANAWRSGANDWTPEQRRDYSQSALVVTSSSQQANRAKGDQGPEDWRPTNREVWCGYAVRWIEIKDTFSLALLTTTDDITEYQALGEMLDTCDNPVEPTPQPSETTPTGPQTPSGGSTPPTEGVGGLEGPEQGLEAPTGGSGQVVAVNTGGTVVEGQKATQRLETALCSGGNPRTSIRKDSQNE